MGFDLATKLTQKEADMLISMLKESIEKNIEIPISKANRTEFDVVEKINKNEEFIINIARKGINSQAMTYQARYPRTGEILLRLDINPSTFHRNPDGEKIEGNHLHVFTEGFGEKYAFPFDVKDKNFHEVCMEFFEEFNLVDKPNIRYVEPLPL